MKILGIESSSMTASVALVSDDIVMAEFTINNKRTHSLISETSSCFLYLQTNIKWHFK